MTISIMPSTPRCRANGRATTRFRVSGDLGEDPEDGYYHAGRTRRSRGRRHGRRWTPPPSQPAGSPAYTVTHDQVGNRAIGDRPSQNLDFGQLAVEAALALGSPYTAMLFMGEGVGIVVAVPVLQLTSNPNWPGPPSRAARASSPNTDGTPTRYPTRGRDLPASSSTGTRSTTVITAGYSGSTAT